MTSREDCKRMYDGRPAPLAGKHFISVWSDNQRESQSRTCLDEIYRLYVTITIRCSPPWDRWLDFRDELEARHDHIRALVHADSLDFRITRAAMALAHFTWDPANTADPIGWAEALAYDGADALQTVGPDWFHATTGSGMGEVGLAQKMRFGKSRRIQAMPTMH